MRLSLMGDMRRVRRMLAGDHRTAERWVVSEYPVVFRLLRSLTGSREWAEDLAQQTFVEAWQGLARYRGEASLRTWLLRVAYHQYTHWLRERREVVSASELSEDFDPTAAAGLASVMLEHALRQLPEEQRQVFLLFYVQQMSVQEIAELLDIPDGTVKSRLFAARKALREILSDTQYAAKAGHTAVDESRVEVTP